MTGPTMTAATPARPLSDPLRQPATLSHDGIAQRIPHQGRMCLLVATRPKLKLPEFAP